jgi:hypothetical protein
MKAKAFTSLGLNSQIQREQDFLSASFATISVLANTGLLGGKDADI